MTFANLELELHRDEAPLERGSERIEAFLAGHRCSERVRFIAALLFEEAVSNIFKRAQPAPATCRVAIELGTDEDVVMTICDDGVPFNPCDASPPPRPASLDDAPDGGRGIWLMRRMSSSMRYARIDGQNRLELRIADPQPAGREVRPQ